MTSLAASVPREGAEVLSPEETVARTRGHRIKDTLLAPIHRSYLSQHPAPQNCSKRPAQGKCRIVRVKVAGVGRANE